jgi:uncharacterized Fe-S center protein
MTSTVFFSDMRASKTENMFDKIGSLLGSSGLAGVVTAGGLVAIKIHFGEKGNHAFIRPVFVRRVVEEIKKCGGLPFLTDSSTLYPGERKNAVEALTCAIENGFAYAVVGAPLIMCDGLRGHAAVDRAVKGEFFEKVRIAADIVEADSLVAVSHFKCHELTGFGGALKNLGMGCSSRDGKLQQHSTLAPVVSSELCIACGACLRACAHDAIAIASGCAHIEPQLCVGCGRCVSSCPHKAVKVQWNEASSAVMKKMAEHARGVLLGKERKSLFLNFITQVSPACDCYGHADAPIVNDIGICASQDPVALDQACVDLVNAAPGNRNTALKSGFKPGEDKFKGVHPNIEWAIQLEHAEKMELGTRKYRLVAI